MKGQTYYHAHFDGNIGRYYPVFIKNIIFTILTLGMYHAWAVTKNRKYFLSHFEIAGARFLYHGTGTELFFSRLKVLASLVAMILAYIWFYLNFPQDYFFIIAVSTYILLFVLTPIAIIGILKYRLTRTSWNHVRMNFTGDWREFLPIYVNGSLLSVVTLGFFTPFFTIKVCRYLINNTWLGNKQYSFDGNSHDLLHIYLKGMILTILTLGIYFFWFLAQYTNYLINHISIDGKRHHFTATGSDYLVLIIPNLVVTIISFGLGTPIAYVQTFKFLATHLYLDADFDPKSVKPYPYDLIEPSSEAMQAMIEVKTNSNSFEKPSLF